MFFELLIALTEADTKMPSINRCTSQTTWYVVAVLWLMLQSVFVKVDGCHGSIHLAVFQFKSCLQEMRRQDGKGSESTREELSFNVEDT